MIEPTEEPVIEPTEEPVTEPTEEPVVEPTEEPVVEPTEEPVAEPTEEPVVEPTEEPVVEPTEEPAIEPTEEPVVEPTEEPVVEPTEEPVEEPTAEPTAEPTETPKPYDGPIAVGNAEVHAAPDANSPVVFTAPDGAAIKVFSTEGDWAKVEAHGFSGYLHRDHVRGVAFSQPVVEPTAEPTEEPVAEPTIEPAIGSYVTKLEATDIRVAADGMSDILATVPAGTQLTVLASLEGDSGYWIRVRYGSVIGYIYTRADEPEQPQEKMEVLIFTSRRAVLSIGDPITLTSELHGFDGYEIMYQWQCDRGAGFQDIPGANGATYTFEATEDTLQYSWMLEVYYR